ncbi:cryptochrome/photolyase family protein [Saccharicrinis sp. 156]|uniref:cryptochrome/photolyase family protein n=1 Tax=Saccharicrinis sp. 156 TaxID=3417574 RepID=UPI003D3525C2
MKSTTTRINIVWLRNELRLADNAVIQGAAREKQPILVVYIFDESAVCKLDSDDSRISFIHDRLNIIYQELKGHGSSLWVARGNVVEIWKTIFQKYNVNAIYAAEDYEPDGIKRDGMIADLCVAHRVGFQLLKDRVIFAKDEVVKKDQSPYSVYTPYKRQWLRRYQDMEPIRRSEWRPVFLDGVLPFPSLRSLGFDRGRLTVKDFTLEGLEDYGKNRDYPFKNSGSNLGPHLRYGTTCIRKAVEVAMGKSEVFLSELIWREFFMQALYHFPHSATRNFKKQYDFISWRNNEMEFELWCNGKTGFPMVDAGMRELNESGYMHNRTRMVVASFLCKHLLIDWRWGEAYFSSRLLDYEMASNIGNWQWAAGTGCDAAPYFRVFNPTSQQEKFDPDFIYIKQWIPEFGTGDYPKPMLDHAMARERAIRTYKEGIVK